MAAFRTRPAMLLQMMRAQFLIGILFPLTAGMLIAVHHAAAFHLLGFLLVLGVGLGLHIATNVYNDVYDTLQHADTADQAARGTLSGGSGLLLANPALMSTMKWLARSGLLLSLVFFLAFLTQIDTRLWPGLILIYGTSVFLSKYYTAAPIKLGYRGLGELFVWFSFGPLAVMLGILSQNLPLEPWILPYLPLTGLTTLTIQWYGQLMDEPSDRAGGKRGLVIRMGTSRARYGYLALHLLILTNFLYVAWILPTFLWAFLAALIVYLTVSPRLWITLWRQYDQPPSLRAVSLYNGALYFTDSLLFLLGVGSTLLFH
jgi:1,4-dihydroxy-2-naphthoate octaprenyltransferase